LMVALMLAIAAGVGAALIIEQCDQTFHSGDAIREFTTVPVLATIPNIRLDAGKATPRFVVTAASVLVLIALVATVSAHVARGNEQIVWMLARGA